MKDMWEIVLLDGRFGRVRELTVLDVVSGASLPAEEQLLNLLSRVVTLDGESFTREQWADMDYEIAAPLIGEVAHRLEECNSRKGVA